MSQLVSEVVERWPTPPRPVPVGTVLATTLMSSVGAFGFGFGFLALISGASFALLDPTPIGFVSAIALATFGIFLVAIPVRHALRLRHALITGQRSTAEVVSLDRIEGPGRRTLDAMKNGFAAGIRRVHHASGDFEERFESDQVGAADLRVGSTMLVLTGPTPDVLLDLGPAVERGTRR